MGKVNVYVDENDYDDTEKIPSPEEIARLVDNFVDDVTEIDLKYIRTEVVREG